MPSSPPVVLVAAGSDPSGGAGLQADLAVLADHGVHGAAAVTALTVQNTRGVRSVHPVEASVVEAQLRAVLEELPVGAIKLGMLGDQAVLTAVARVLGELGAGVPVVLDPVLRSTSGAALLSPDALEALLEALLPRVSLITPNLPELAVLEGSAGDLSQRCARLGVALLIKGGHGSGEELVDRLLLPGGERIELVHPRQAGPDWHGTGCALSSSIAARLASGRPLPEAVEGAVDYLQRRMAGTQGWMRELGLLARSPER
jgi:hydroxymethylpyrimidine/phosphomethylpyrimidine kinase